MRIIFNKLESIFLITVFGMLLIALSASAECKNPEPVNLVEKKVNGFRSMLVAQQIIFKCENGSFGVGLNLYFVGPIIDKMAKNYEPGSFAFWLKINNAELSHSDLLTASDPEYWRNATWNIDACFTSPMTKGIYLGGNCSVDEQTESQRAVLVKNVIGDKILPWDIQVAIDYRPKNEWDNNGGPGKNYRIHFDENSLSHSHGGSHEE